MRNFLLSGLRFELNVQHFCWCCCFVLLFINTKTIATICQEYILIHSHRSHRHRMNEKNDGENSTIISNNHKSILFYAIRPIFICPLHLFTLSHSNIMPLSNIFCWLTMNYRQFSYTLRQLFGFEASSFHIFRYLPYVFQYVPRATSLLPTSLCFNDFISSFSISDFVVLLFRFQTLSVFYFRNNKHKMTKLVYNK